MLVDVDKEGNKLPILQILAQRHSMSKKKTGEKKGDSHELDFIILSVKIWSNQPLKSKY